MPGVLIHVQHLLGSGHLHRVARVANALASLGVPVTLCSGGEPVRTLGLAAGVRLVQLEPLHCDAADFTTLLDSRGRPADEALCARRREQLVQALASASPGVALIESFPFARRQMRFELLPLLEELRGHGIPVVCSIRDILQIKTRPERARETLALLADYFTAVLVHGDRRVIALQATFSAAAQIPCDVHYTGYVAALPAVSRAASAVEAADIVVSAGGGAVGYPLLQAAMDTCLGGCQSDRRWRFLLGEGLTSGPRKRLLARVPDNARVTPASEHFAALLRQCTLSISQAGYNTVVDVLQARCRALVVPYAERGEMEQSLRAERLSELGVVARCAPTDLTAARLAACVDEVIGREPAPVEDTVDLSGAQTSARLLLALAARPA